MVIFRRSINLIVKTFFSISSCLVSYVTFPVHVSSRFAVDYSTYHGFLFLLIFFKSSVFSKVIDRVRFRLPVISFKVWLLVTLDWLTDRGIILVTEHQGRGAGVK